MTNHRAASGKIEARELNRAIVRFTRSAEEMRRSLSELCLEAKKSLPPQEWCDWLEETGIDFCEGEALAAYAETLRAPPCKQDQEDWVKFIQAV